MKRPIHTGIILKIISALLLCALTLSTLAGCTKSVTDGAKSSKEDLRVVGKIGDYEVLYDEYRYVVLSCKSILSQKYGNDIWSTPEGIEKYSPMLEEMVAERITANYAVLILCEANGYKNALTDKDAVSYVNAQIEKTIYDIAVEAGYSVEVTEKLNGEVNYKYGSGELKKARALYDEALAEYFLTERVMRLTLGAEFAFKKLSTILTTEKNEIIHTAEDIERFIKSDDFICTRHVFIEKTKNKSYEELKAAADTVYQMYLDGASMDSLIGSKYNMDTSMPYEGYYFTYGEMDQEYEEMAFSLSVGEVSTIVETERGFYLIQRYEKNEDYMLNNLENFASQIVYTFVNEMVREVQSNLVLEKNELGRSLVLHEITAP